METYNSYRDIAMSQMDMIDLWLIVVVLIVACILRTVKAHFCLVTTMVLFIIGFVLPLASSGREVQRDVAISGPAIDAFELYYVYLVFPIYWIVTLLVLVIIYLKGSPSQKNSDNSS